MRMSEEAPEPQSLTKRCTEMSAEDFEAAEEAAAAKIRQRLKEIEEERKILPPEKDVAEVIKGELPSANPEARPRSPSPTRKWKPPPPPPAPPDSESDLELDPESVPPGTDIAGDESSTGWEQDENRPATRSGIEHAVALTATETIDSHYPDASGRQSPSFYDEEGELMVRAGTQMGHSPMRRCHIQYFTVYLYLHMRCSTLSCCSNHLSDCPGVDIIRSRALTLRRSDGSMSSSWRCCWHPLSTKTCSAV